MKLISCFKFHLSNEYRRALYAIISGFNAGPLIKLIRLNSPTGYWLVFFPACWGIALAGNLLSNFKLLFLFFVGSIVVRSSGCIINDIFDRDFDRNVERTKERPLVNQSISLKTALSILILLLLIALSILLTLAKTAIYLGFLAFLLTIIYPLMKRITYMPQLFLGLTFNMGVLIGYASIADALSVSAILLYLACCFWTISYDTIYGFMDIADDKKIGVKSMAILLENRNYKVWLSLFYTSFIVLFIVAFYLENKLGFMKLISIVVSSILLSWQVNTLNIHDPLNCLVRFKNNNYVGGVLLLALILF